MALWARFSDDGASKGVVAETFTFTTDPHPLFAPAWLWIEAPAEAVEGSAFDGSAWTHPASIAPPTVDPTEPARSFRLKLTPSEFRNAFSAFEEVKIVEFAAGESEGDSAERRTLRKVVGVFFDRLKDQHLTTVDLEDPRNLAGLDILVSVGILTTDRRATIAQGLPA